MIQIPKLPPLAETSLEALPSLHQNLPSLSFRQHWLETQQPLFTPGTVQIGGDATHFSGYAVLKDRKPENRARQRGDCTWEMGNLFEIFVKREDRPDYWEIHITPKNFRLIFHLPPASERQGASIQHFFDHYWRELPQFESKVWIEPDQTQWRVAWKIPWETFGKEDPHSVNWKMAFCRYDYDKPGSAPVLSSVCPLTRPSYHRIDEWLDFKIAQ